MATGSIRTTCTDRNRFLTGLLIQYRKSGCTPRKGSTAARRLSKSFLVVWRAAALQCNPNPATCAADSEALDVYKRQLLTLHSCFADPPRLNRRLAGQVCSDCQKTLPGGLEGRSPPNVIRIRRHVRRMRKPCLARFPCAVSRPGVPQGREGNSVQLSEKDAVGGLFRHTETAMPFFDHFSTSLSPTN